MSGFTTFLTARTFAIPRKTKIAHATFCDRSLRVWGATLVSRGRQIFWIFVCPSSKVTQSITNVLLEWFLDFGFPEIIFSDGGPQYRSEFKQFCTKWKITHHTSSPYFPQSNGLAEAAVKNAKYLVIKCLKTNETFEVALSEFRRMPRKDGFSPSQLMFGYTQRGLLPRVSQKRVDMKEAQQSKDHITLETKKFFDRHSNKLPALQVGNKVRVQHPVSKRWDKNAEIVAVHDNLRSYEIKFDNGKISRRNRRFLRLQSSQVRTDQPVQQNPEKPKSYAEVAKGRLKVSPLQPILRRSPRLAAKKSISWNSAPVVT